MFIGGKTPAPWSGAPSPVDASSRRNISRRIWSKSEKELSNVGREGQTRRTSMIDLLGLSARFNVAIRLRARIKITNAEPSRPRLLIRSGPRFVARLGQDRWAPEETQPSIHTTADP